MPAENRSTIVVPRELLSRWLMDFGRTHAALNELKSDTRAILAQPAQHQGEPVALPKYRRDRKHNSHDWDEGHMEGWAECFEEFTKLGPLYTHPAPAEQQGYPSEDELIANGLGYPISKEDAVKLHYAGYRSEVITILEAWEAIGHDIHINPDKQELLESLRNMAAICAAHGFDMPADPGEVERLRAELTDTREAYLNQSARLVKANQEIERLKRPTFAETIKSPPSWVRAALSASAEPVAPVERDERAEFEKAYQAAVDHGWSNVKHLARQLWDSRAALERKP